MARMRNRRLVVGETSADESSHGPRDAVDPGPLMEALLPAASIGNSLGPTRLSKAGAFGTAALATLFAWMAVHAPPRRWLIDYYPNRNLQGVTRSGDLQNGSFASIALLPTGLIDREDFSIRLRTCLILPTSGQFLFRLTADDGARLYIDGELAIDRWDNSSRALEREGLKLAQGAHSMVVEYFNASGPGFLKIEMADLVKRSFRSVEQQIAHPEAGGDCNG